MGGFSKITGQESIVNADNASFDGTERDGRMVSNGQLWIGSTVAPHVRLGTIAGGSNITSTSSAGGIAIAVSGTTNHAVQVGSLSGSLTSIAVGSTGMLLGGLTGGDPSFASTSDGDFTFTTSTAAVARTLKCRSLEASDANSRSLIISETQAGGGDCVFRAQITGGGVWSFGGDNSASDNFVMSFGTTLGTADAFRIDATVPHSSTFLTGNSGSPFNLFVKHTVNSGASSANIQVETAGSTAGDATFTATTTATTWTLGVDNSVTTPTADPFVLSQGTTLGTNNIMSVATSGETNWPLQPAFLARNSSTRTDVTGDATVYTLIYDTEIYDQNSDFDGTSTFTAPVTGRYFLTATVLMTGILLTHTVLAYSLVTSNRTYGRRQQPFNTCDANTDLSLTLSVVADMDAADTATVTLSVSNGTKVVDISGTAVFTHFSGYLVA